MLILHSSPEKESKASKERRNQELKENNNQTKKRKRIGRKPDLMIKDKKISENNKTKRHEYLMGEVAGDPWCKERLKSIVKIKSDKNKLFRIMKDTYDSIIKHYVKKSNSFILENFKDLELYGFLISGFYLRVFVIDKKCFGVYRIREVDCQLIPVKEENNLFVKSLELIINMAICLKDKIKELDNILNDKNRNEHNKNKKLVLSSLQKTRRSPSPPSKHRKL